MTVPAANVFIDPGMKSPLTHEFTRRTARTSAAGKGYAEVTYVGRNTTNLIEDFITRADGTTDVVANGIDAGEVSNRVYPQHRPGAPRVPGLVFQGRYQPDEQLDASTASTRSS